MDSVKLRGFGLRPETPHFCRRRFHRERRILTLRFSLGNRETRGWAFVLRLPSTAPTFFVLDLGPANSAIYRKAPMGRVMTFSSSLFAEPEGVSKTPPTNASGAIDWTY